MTKPEFVKKPLGYRLLELLRSLQVMADCLAMVRRGRTHQLIPVSGQLRSLLTERSKGNKPLLLALATELKSDLLVFAMPGVDKAALPVTEGLLLHVAGFPLSLERELSAQEQISLAKFLDRKIVRYKTSTYTVRDIIEVFANKAGGSHYSSVIPKDFAELLSLRLAGQTVLSNGLQQVAELTLRSGTRVFRNLAEFEVNIAGWIPRQELTVPAHLLDHAYPNTPMRIAIGIGPGMQLFFGVRGMDERQASVSLDGIDWTKAHQLSFAHSLRDDLVSQLSIGVDGKILATTNADGPLLVVNDPLQYQSYMNRSQEDAEAGMTFCLSEHVCHGRSHDEKDRAELAAYFQKRLSADKAKGVLFRKGQFGAAAPGTKNLTMTGGPVSCDLHSVMKAPTAESKSG